MTPRHVQMTELGAELRRLRIAAGLSMGGLASLIHFSKGYISKVETGQQMSPSSHFVRTADAALGAGGRLIALAEDQTRAETNTIDQPAGSLDLAPQASVQIESKLTDRPAATIDEAEAVHSLNAFSAILKQLRDLGQTINPSTVVDMLKPHISALQYLTPHLDASLTKEARRLAAHFAEFTSWMTQETGDDVTALQWIDLSADLARQANDVDLIANTYLRRSNIALYQQDAYGTISFAKQVQAMECAPKLAFLAALREAQGHALGGDYDKFRICKERAVELREKGALEPEKRPLVARQPIGSTKIRDLLALSEGWSLHDLGRSTEAIQVLEPLLAVTHKTDNRAWARVASRLALALASAREVDRACSLAREILSLTTVARSATIRSDLRQLSRTLNRWSYDPTVREMMPLLSAALSPSSGGHLSPPPQSPRS